MKHEGFTLIETMLAILILSILVISFYSIINFTGQVSSKEIEYLTDRQKGQLALNLIISYLREAEEITVNESGIEFKGYYLDEGEKWISFQLYDSNSVQTLGIKSGDKIDGEIDYSYIMPLVSGVTKLKFVNINGDKTLLKVILGIGKRNFTGFVATGEVS